MEMEMRVKMKMKMMRMNMNMETETPPPDPRSAIPGSGPARRSPHTQLSILVRTTTGSRPPPLVRTRTISSIPSSAHALLGFPAPGRRSLASERTSERGSVGQVWRLAYASTHCTASASARSENRDLLGFPPFPGLAPGPWVVVTGSCLLGTGHWATPLRCAVGWAHRGRIFWVGSGAFGAFACGMRLA